MVTLAQTTAQQLQIPDPPVRTIRHLTARIRRQWSPEERLLRVLQAQLLQQWLLQQ